ncbi:unnamed protein product [Nippostrongylus brasiliensis]|uniref:DRIM domain-containing protein n=1 Tax=Nippostrongylus brasiliensis TaxID=27835 RepID=A0A0N4YBQ4_NIPBR|nr:unnamed protein product [Nippostrongylus brasiliensis]
MTKLLQCLTFNQSVAAIGGDNAKFSRRLSHRPVDCELFFTEALTKWNDQDFGAQYTAFVDSLPSDELNTHAQLLHHKATICELLLKNLQDPECKSVQAFCELLSGLVRDLKEDFRENMWDFFGALTNVLDFGERDVESVEAAFFTLSLVVRIMWRSLIKDFTASFVRFIPLFGSSRPYVRRFAAESFSFIMRKSSKLDVISRHVVEQAHKVQDERLIEGCAELFFHVCRGVSGGFHSAAKEQVSSIINGVLAIEDIDVRECGMSILEKTMQCIVQYVQRASKGDLSFLETTLIEMSVQSNSMDNCTYLVRLIPICFVQRKWVNLFSSHKQLMAGVETVLSKPFFTINTEFSSFLSKSINYAFTTEDWGKNVGSLCSKLISLRNGDLPLVLNFLESLHDRTYFDAFVAPVIGTLADRVFNEMKDLSVSSSLMKIYSLICSTKRPLRFLRSEVLEVANHNALKRFVESLLPELGKLENSLAASTLEVWPWMYDTTEEPAGVDFVSKYLKDLLDEGDVTIEQMQLALLAGASIFLIDKKRLRNIEVANVERRTALEILNSFSITLEGVEGDESAQQKEDISIFGIMLNAECTEIIDSRGRLLHLSKLTFGSHTKFTPKGSAGSYDQVILRISLAQFFVQFTKLWPSMYEILESYARGMNIDEFWAIMSEIFEQVNEVDDGKVETVGLLPWCDNNDRFDFPSARIQILKFMSTISDLAQRRTRVLSPILLKIYEDEYLPLIVESVSSKKGGLESVGRSVSSTEDSGAEEATDTNNQQRFNVAKTLCAFLDVYAKFNDAKSVYMESKIRKMYEHLLMVGNDSVQKSVMACIFSYREKALLPYRENFDKLLDEKSFREQLVLFTISEEEGNSVIHLDHRPAVMHILLRFLYGRLWTHAKRNVVNSRRAAIFRYLGGCRPEELLDFLKILFAPILDVIGSEELNYRKMDELCSDRDTLFRMDFGKIDRREHFEELEYLVLYT